MAPEVVVPMAQQTMPRWQGPPIRAMALVEVAQHPVRMKTERRAVRVLSYYSIYTSLWLNKTTQRAEAKRRGGTNAGATTDHDEPTGEDHKQHTL